MHNVTKYACLHDERSVLKKGSGSMKCKKIWSM